MNKKNYRFYIGIVSAIILYILAVAVIILNPSFFYKISVEDGVIEIVSAISFLLASIFFLGFLFKNKEIVRKTNVVYRSFFIICWIIFTFICFGEEISWGQRVIGFELVDELKVENYQEIEGNFKNIQNETNIHNMGFVEKIGNRVILAFIQFVSGLVLPLLIIFKPFKKFFKKIYLPVPSIHYVFFIFGGICMIGTKLFYNPAPIDGIYLYDRVNEFSEMMMALGYLFFALECFLFPKRIFN